MTSMPPLCSPLPNHPFSGPYTRMSARPTTIGETETDRSVSEPSQRRPQNQYRVIKSATPTPNSTLMAVAASAISTVSLIAVTASSELIAFQNTVQPSSTVRYVTTNSGTITSTPM